MRKVSTVSWLFFTVSCCLLLPLHLLRTQKQWGRFYSLACCCSSLHFISVSLSLAKLFSGYKRQMGDSPSSRKLLESWLNVLKCCLPSVSSLPNFTHELQVWVETAGGSFLGGGCAILFSILWRLTMEQAAVKYFLPPWAERLSENSLRKVFRRMLQFWKHRLIVPWKDVTLFSYFIKCIQSKDPLRKELQFWISILLPAMFSAKLERKSLRGVSELDVTQHGTDISCQWSEKKKA